MRNNRVRSVMFQNQGKDTSYLRTSAGTNKIPFGSKNPQIGILPTGSLAEHSPLLIFFIAANLIQ